MHWNSAIQKEVALTIQDFNLHMPAVKQRKSMRRTLR